MPAGRPRSYTPESFLEIAEKYVQYADDNPVMIEVPSKAGPMKMAKRYPLNVWDFCRFAGIGIDSYYRYRKNPEYSDASSYIDVNIKAAQFCGAITGEFNGNFVARINDLTEKQMEDNDINVKVEIVNPKSEG